jgi:hypothetical protein
MLGGYIIYFILFGTRSVKDKLSNKLFDLVLLYGRLWGCKLIFAALTCVPSISYFMATTMNDENAQSATSLILIIKAKDYIILSYMKRDFLSDPQLATLLYSTLL